MRVYLFVLFAILFSKAKAQQGNSGMVYSLATEKGNIVRYWPSVKDMDEFGRIIKDTRRFIIRRSTTTTGDLVFQEIGNVTFPRKSANLKEWISEKDYAEIKGLFNVKSDNELDTYLAKSDNVGGIVFLMEMKYELLLAFGMGFLDKDVKKGEFYQYEILREDMKGNMQNWGSTALFAKEGNVELERVQVAIDTTTAMDSSVTFNWKVVIPDFTAINFDDIYDSTRRQINRIKTYRGNSGYKEALSLFNRYPLNTGNTNFSIYYRINDQKEWILKDRQLAGKDSSKTGDFISVTIACNPEDIVEAVIIPHDFGFNKGSMSEPARVMAVTVNSVMMIGAVEAKDSVNSIILSWEKLPEKAYYSGIEIAKSWGQNERKVVTVLSANATGYTDFEVFPAGRQYSYYVRALFTSVNDIQQDVPSTVIHSCTTFSKPAIPYNLLVIQQDSLIKITWDANEDPALHSYHVLRGTNPNDMSLISGNVLTKEFYDSTKNLDTRRAYFYTVMAMNVMQDTSQYAEMVQFSMTRKGTIQPPPMVTFEVINKDGYLTWDDIKLNDFNIAGYIVQKDNGSGFKTMHTGLLEDNNFIDKTFEINKEFYYRVASVSISGDTSQFSPATTVPNPGIEYVPNAVQNIKLTRLSNSVRITWPSVIMGSTHQFRVYRRLPQETEFILLKELNPTVFEFEDKDIQTGNIYIYTITAVSDKNKESKINEEPVIRIE